MWINRYQYERLTEKLDRLEKGYSDLLSLYKSTNESLLFGPPYESVGYLHSRPHDYFRFKEEWERKNKIGIQAVINLIIRNMGVRLHVDPQCTSGPFGKLIKNEDKVS